MGYQPAPLLLTEAGTPPRGTAVWAETSDSVRIRVGLWPSDSAAKGTVLILPGRTEYIEKYADAISAMLSGGYAVAVIDWRGQGLARRLLDDKRLGHVNRFTDYQLDLEAAIAAVDSHDLPAPYHLIGHSMGGCIGLRAAMDRADIATAAFTGPMWGIAMSPLLKPLGHVAAYGGTALGLGHTLAPSSSIKPYVLEQPFDDNTLTTDQPMYQMMRAHLQAHPELALGGPTLHWLREALDEMKALAERPSPDLPCLCYVGNNERIVDIPAIRDRMGRWPGGTLHELAGKEHEVLMEDPEQRRIIYDQLLDLFGSIGS
ncbi:alpha/beta hydrolase [Primorskyibacter sp. S87]|uniref:alpha/beta hydrolase n=1 Tax=Primorskyibacter sp. S87 TaxID=3415126 RepID=UPI003C7A8A5D